MKTLLYDLEVFPNRGFAYGRWKTNLLTIEEYGRIFSFSYKWLRDKKTHHVSIQNTSYSDMIQKLHDLMDEADIVIAHNAYSFDNKVSNAAFIAEGLAPPEPFKVVDTLRVARQQFRYPGGNSLDEVGRYLGLGTKEAIGIGQLWYACYNGDKKAFRLLKKYNNQDVILMEKVYLRMLPYIRNHPNIGDLYQRHGICPKCGSDHLQSRGFNKRANGQTRRYQCMTCGGWCNESTLKGNGRVVNAQ